MNRISNLEIDEISLLSKGNRPAVRGALVAITKSAGMAFEAKVAEIRKRDSCSRTVALEKMDAADIEAMRQAGLAATENDEPDAGAIAKMAARRSYMAKVAEIQALDRISKSAAMERASRQFPDAHEAAFGR